MAYASPSYQQQSRAVAQQSPHSQDSQSVERELWNIFTFYTLAGAATDPEHLRATQFVRFGRDVGLIGPNQVSEAEEPLLEADLHVAYTAEVKRPNRSGMHRMNYNDFLTVLMKLSVRVYPSARSIDEAFQRLLMENVLPSAWRRNVEPVDDVLYDPDVQRLYAFFRDALEQIFQFYATNPSVSSPGKKESPRATGRSPLSRASNSMKSALGYPEFLKFASDFNLANSVLLSTRELGDIYLSSIHNIQPDATIRKLSFDEFWESLVRCAERAYGKISHASPLDRIRGLFLYMWRSITTNVPHTVQHRQGISTYAGDLLSGAMLFNKRFTAMWAEDGYRDYLSPDAPREESGKAVLNRLTNSESGMSALQRALPDMSNESPTNNSGYPMFGGHPMTSPMKGGHSSGTVKAPGPPSGPPPPSAYIESANGGSTKGGSQSLSTSDFYSRHR
eukprot:gb/GECG01012389.1/.p1 GENE.gb/GECG01012389.1/~~gb/GECG01012389.1/.p1  ORF type:complete len:448 (+),score=40.15 gb/GECG01012389.1/:1-1344(+)